MDNNTDKENTEKEFDLKAVKQNTYTIFFKLLIILLIPAIVGAFIGRFIDSKFEVYPWGTLGTLLAFNVLTWVLIIRYAHLLKKKDNK